MPEGYKITVFLYNADKKAQKYIQSNFDNFYLYERKEDKLCNMKILSVDLWFFMGSKLL